MKLYKFILCFLILILLGFCWWLPIENKTDKNLTVIEKGIPEFTLENALDGTLDSFDLSSTSTSDSITLLASIGMYQAYRGLKYTQLESFTKVIETVKKIQEEIYNEKCKDCEDNYPFITNNTYKL